MKHSIIPIFLFFFLAFTLSIKLAYAIDEVSLTDWPTYLATQLGVSVFVAGLMSAGIILALFLFPTLILSRGKNTALEILVGIIALGITVGLGWLNIFFFIVVILIICALWGVKLVGVMR